jgi:hypothetical protein
VVERPKDRSDEIDTRIDHLAGSLRAR